MPESWKVLYKDNGIWKEVEGVSGYGTKMDAYNRVAFKPINTASLRIEAKLKAGFLSGHSGMENR